MYLWRWVCSQLSMLIYAIRYLYNAFEVQGVSFCTCLWVNFIEHPGVGDGLAQVGHAAEPGHQALDAHAEAGVGHRAVAAQVEVPLEGFPWEVVLLDALLYEGQVVDALRATADFAVALGGYEVSAEHHFGASGVGLHIERLG